MALGWSGIVILVVGALQRVEAESRGVVHADEAVAALKRAARSVAVAAGGEAGAVGRVVGRLADDDRVLTGLEHAGAVWRCA